MGKKEKAEELFLQGYNCAQAVAGVFAEEMGMDFDTVVKTVSSFGGGMGRMREVCGTVTGMFFVAGAVYGYKDPKDFAAKKEHYERIQLLAARFKEETGSIICRELLGMEGSDKSPVPQVRTAEYYQKRPCAQMAGLAAGIMEEYMAQMRQDAI
ncbi:MAG: C_GCAxxG_C_C family protein [Eubacterium sp.]|jgi:C_GCAxxG_C_C family probable redox protein|nr:C_GCAxxG_C_C family protein [Eubacterium sp.]NBI86055.1 C_GCAxxG_C_C family protein [Lachnospiraceae bacterium]